MINLLNKILKCTCAIVLIFLFGLCSPRQNAVAKRKLNVLENKYGRNLVNKDANKIVGTIEKGDTFQIVNSKREPATDFYLYYKVKSRNGIDGYLFEGDSFTIIE